MPEGELLETRFDNPRQYIEVYFDEAFARAIADREQNAKNFRTRRKLDAVIMTQIADKEGPLQVAELGGGAHVDSYDRLFNHLLTTDPPSAVDWVDLSPHMLALIPRYLTTSALQRRMDIVTTKNQDILGYVKEKEAETLDLAVMKYTFNFIPDLDVLFQSFQKSLAVGGRVVATMTMVEPIIRSHSTNATFLHRGEKIPEGETRELQDGESFGILYNRISGDHHSGYLNPGKPVQCFYHSKEKIEALAKKYDLDVFVGDWRELVPVEQQGDIEGDQRVLVLRKG